MSIPLPVVAVWDGSGASALGYVTGYASLTMSDVFCDVGALQLDAPRSSAVLLDTDLDRMLKVTIPYTAGAVSSWWVVDDDTSTWISDDTDTETIKIGCRSVGALLDETIVYPSGGAGATPAEWSWTTATPGKIVTDLVGASQARGLLPGVTVSGTATVDADGTAWPTTITVTHKAGTTLLSVMKTMVDSGLLEYAWSERVLQLYVGGGLGVPAGSATALLRPGIDVTSAPLARARKPQATTVLVVGDADVNTSRSQTLTGRRPREAYVAESKAAVGTIAQLGDLYLAAHTAADVQITHEVTDSASTPSPWVDYRPGDMVLTKAAGSQLLERRVQQIAVSAGPSGVRATVELGSILKTREDQMTQAMRRLLPGEGVVT